MSIRFDPRMERLAREEVVRQTPAAPWEAKALARQGVVRDGYRRKAEELRRSSSAADHELATRLEQFVAKMPTPETRRSRLSGELQRALEKAQAQPGVQKKAE